MTLSLPENRCTRSASLYPRTIYVSHAGRWRREIVTMGESREKRYKSRHSVMLYGPCCSPSQKLPYSIEKVFFFWSNISIV
jgi:hypothetical protein